jgi:hypothetical protein
VQPGKASENASENAGDAKETTSQAGLWGIIASPARDLMLQLATVLLLGALVVATFLRRNGK